MEGKTCAFTGHRPHKLPFGYNEDDPRCRRLKEALLCCIREMIEKENVRHFITGMALGVDMFAAEAVLSLKKKDPRLTLEAAVPCANQSARWSEEMRHRYACILSGCDKVTPLQEFYTMGCMERRNRYMVEQADFLIAVWDGSPGGTSGTLRYARSLGRSIFIIDPTRPEVAAPLV